MASDPSILNEFIDIDEEPNFIIPSRKLFRRKSCYCSKCGQLSKFESKIRDNDTIIRSKCKLLIKGEKKIEKKLSSRTFYINENIIFL